MNDYVQPLIPGSFMYEERRSNQSTMLKRHIQTTRKLEEDKFFVDCGIHVYCSVKPGFIIIHMQQIFIQSTSKDYHLSLTLNNKDDFACPIVA